MKTETNLIGGEPLELPDVLRERLSDEVIDELLAGARSEEEIVGPGGVLAQLTKRLVERAMSAELTEHLGYEPHQEPPGGTGNTRNGSTPKTLATEQGPVRIETPRDRKGSFEPQIVRKGQRRFQGFDEKILALYSRGVSRREIEVHLAEIYGVKVGRDLISRVTDAVAEDVREWQQRPRARLLHRLATTRPAGRHDPELRGSLLALRSIARRVLALTAEERELAREIDTITRKLAPQLLDQPGVGPHAAAQLVLSWSHRGRIEWEAAFARLAGAAPIPASSGQTIRYRLDRSGDRKLNRALHMILVTRKRTHPATIAYIERRLQEGKTQREANRCLKRYLARSLYRLLEHGPPMTA